MHAACNNVLLRKSLVLGCKGPDGMKQGNLTLIYRYKLTKCFPR